MAATNTSTSLDLSSLPPIFVSASKFDIEDLHELEEDLSHAGAALTYDIQEADIIISRATQPKRIAFDLRSKGLLTKPVEVSKVENVITSKPPPGKKRTADGALKSEGDSGSTVEDSETESESDGESESKTKHIKTETSTSQANQKNGSPSNQERNVTVVSVSWFEDSKKLGLQPLTTYITYRGQHVDNDAADTSTSLSQRTTPSKPSQTSSTILQRAQQDSPKSSSSSRFGNRRFNFPTPSSTSSTRTSTQPQYAHLLQETTTEHEEGISSDLPEMPEWVKTGIKYACQRRTPATNPNDPFISQLKNIKHARLLTNDEIGVRAYSTSIAALAAYTHKISNPREILLLPGCEVKIANLFIEWTNTGKIQSVEDLDADPDLKILDLFYNIWGVGVTTAREFLYDKGWREMDDIIEFGWSGLSRVQQIGVKYYEEFLDPIPRAEVEGIWKIIHEHAVKCRDGGIQSMIVGGYRRGKEASGDVDIIISHPDESKTLNLIEDLVASLEDEWITHTLIVSLNNSKRNQETLPFRSDGGGHGFDTLDKALVVWQDPEWPTKTSDLAKDPGIKNPNIHRRVDIIISPWRTVGCAVVGWSGATTFQRDLRRFAKNEKGWKFDSSGVRSRGTGEVVDLEKYFGEGEEGKAQSMEGAERRVFEGFGLEWREPWERCTG